MIDKYKIAQELSEKGYATFNIPEDETVESFANKIGVTFKHPSYELVQNLTIKPSNNKDNTYSNKYGERAFPLHSDLAHWGTPPRYIILHCEVPDPDTFTKVIHINELIKNIKKENLSRAIFIPRKPINNQVCYLKMYHNKIFRWDNLFLKAVNIEAENAQKELKDSRTKIKNKINSIKLDEKGSSIIIDNWQALHGRSRASIDSKRTINRIYLTELHT